MIERGLSVRYADRSDSVRSLSEEFLEVATVTSVLDRLVDDHNIDRRVVEVGTTERSYYRAPSAVLEADG